MKADLGTAPLHPSGCSRQRAQTSKLAHVLVADPRRLAYKEA
jgi:hypothetical protein